MQSAKAIQEFREHKLPYYIHLAEELEKERVFKQKIKNMICEARKKTIKRIMKRKQSQNF